jgi:hypothetical protein
VLTVLSSEVLASPVNIDGQTAFRGPCELPLPERASHVHAWVGFPRARTNSPEIPATLIWISAALRDLTVGSHGDLARTRETVPRILWGSVFAAIIVAVSPAALGKPTACDFPLDETIEQVSEMRLIYAGGMLGLKWMPQRRMYAAAEAKTIAARLQEQWRKNRDEYNRALSRAIENLWRARPDPFGPGSRMLMRAEHGEPLRETPTDVDEAIHFLPAGKGDFEQLLVFAHADCAVAIVSLTGLNAYPVPYSPPHYFARLQQDIRASAQMAKPPLFHAGAECLAKNENGMRSGSAMNLGTVVLALSLLASVGPALAQYDRCQQLAEQAFSVALAGHFDGCAFLRSLAGDTCPCSEPDHAELGTCFSAAARWLREAASMTKLMAACSGEIDRWMGQCARGGIPASACAGLWGSFAIDAEKAALGGEDAYRRNLDRAIENFR